MRHPFYRMSLVLAGAAAVLAVTSCAHSAVAPAPAFTDPKAAGPDYTVQGEYEGKAGTAALGAQVIALGDGKFQAAFLPGGLPGAGWNGKDRFRVEGHAEGERALFGDTASGWSATVSGDTLSGRTDTGEKLTLKQVERKSPTLGLKPPAGAVVLFDGTGTDAWTNGKLTEDGLLQAGTTSRKPFLDFTLHAEFRTPFMPSARGQSRGNSGLYLLGRYELQILDSFGLDGKPEECGGVYRQKAPLVNMCLPPLAWQTYDIELQAARFDPSGTKLKGAVITVRHNGVLIHDRYEITGPTGGAARRPEAGTPAPITIQNHGTPVALRNIWILEKS